jgi:hypothetical protein
MFGKPFEPGREKTGGRQKGTRNKISEAFLKDLHAEWERSGAATLKIMAMESPSEFAKLTGSLLPKQLDAEMPALIVVRTGVPRAGDEEELPMVDVPRIPLEEK